MSSRPWQETEPWRVWPPNFALLEALCRLALLQEQAAKEKEDGR